MTRLADRSLSSSARSSAFISGLALGLLCFACLQGKALAQDAGAASAAQATPVVAPVESAPLVAAPAPKTPLTQGTSAVPDLYLWKQLTPGQQLALSPLAKDWDSLDLSRRRKWLEIATRFPSLPADEQARVQERMSSWAKLSPVERNQARIGYQQAQQIAPESRQAKWEAYQALAPEQRQVLADKAAKKTEAKTGKSVTPISKPVLDNQAKSNLVPQRASAPQPKPVAPTVVQNKPGATTTLINQTSKPPAHQQSGMPKIMASPELVDPNTLLPKRPAASASSTRS